MSLIDPCLFGRLWRHFFFLLSFSPFQAALTPDECEASRKMSKVVISGSSGASGGDCLALSVSSPSTLCCL